tara:strand:- start:491 stop:1825 length:1335 start_codon:yes stop_codon:yes gene_type:complete
MCGIFAIYSQKYTKNNIKDLLFAMKKLQHRGKDGYGLSINDNNNILTTIKKKGEIHTILKNCVDIQKKSKSCIGHLRYSTSGLSIQTGKIQYNEIQPLIGNINDKNYVLCHNGNIPNIKDHDTTYINKKIMKINNSFTENLITIMNEIPAAFSIVILINNEIYAMRDRFGIRPLCIGKKKENYYISSESVGFTNDINYIRDVKPGEIIKINNEGITTLYTHPEAKLGLCLFEILYFLNENSFTDGMYIKNIRKQLGNIMATKDIEFNSNNLYTVIGIPLTGICSGKSYANKLNLKYEQLITKNKNVSRSFIAITDEKRKEICKNKFIYDIEKIKNKKLIIIDDTIVRGNVIKSIINNLRKHGATEVHIRIPAPPVIDICELGICIQSKNELIMNNNTIEGVCKEINANSLKYLSLNELQHIPSYSYNQCFSGYIHNSIKSYKQN